MQLIIAEKPSVAQSIAAALGVKEKKQGYMQGSGYLVSWCVGHLVELAQPEAYGDYTLWEYEDLPILPMNWQFTVLPSTEKQFVVLRQLMTQTDVTEIVCATDAGREGELIFRLVYAMIGCRKPVLRLWISSMEETAVREGFNKLRPAVEYDTLYHAALCRAKADWLVGINATRLFSCLYRQTLQIGRVMTPTLALIVQREAEIAAFKPTPFYNVILALNGFAVTSERMERKPFSMLQCPRTARAACCTSCRLDMYRRVSVVGVAFPTVRVDFTITRERRFSHSARPANHDKSENRKYCRFSMRPCPFSSVLYVL